MTARHLAVVLGATLMFSAGEISVLRAQEQAAGAAALDTPSEGRSGYPGTEAPEANALAKTSYGTRARLVGRFVDDQRRIWTSPARLRFSDTEWLVPLSGVTAGLFVTDRNFSKHLSQNPSTINHYKALSNAGVAALIGGGAGIWLLGHAKHNEHWSETGLLAGEAALNSLVMIEALKYSLRRARPYQGGSGAFFQDGGTSFPSEHAAAAWSVAGVIAHEYPGPLTKIMAYGLASLVDISRVRAHQHFPSDVLVGSVIGNLIAQNIYSRHHDFDLHGGEWRSISQIFRGNGDDSPANQGSPYVPLDSWIYPALDRLAAMAFIDSGFAVLRPWTRNECARLVGDAADLLLDSDKENLEASRLVEALQREFRHEIEGTNGYYGGAFRLESLYSRTEHISGMPLTDGFTFAQTRINDFGRPYGQGWSTVNGFSSYAARGRWVAYVRGEVQTAPSIPALSISARQFSAGAVGAPTLPPDTPSRAIQQFQVLDAYAGLALSNWQVSFGRQSFSWGPGEGGALMISNNAVPIDVFRVNRVSPLQPPSILKLLGATRMEFFVGQLSGHHFVVAPSGATGSWTQTLTPQPFTEGEKISFKPSRDLELGFSYTMMFGGLGVPATASSFVNGLFDTGADLPQGLSKSSRETGLDFSYRIPKLRKWLTLYGDGFAHDQIIFKPNGYPERAVWRAGIYVPAFPGFRKLDFRAEGGYTDNPLGGIYSQGFYNTANRYLNGVTNKGNLLGSWLGRAGQGEQVWANYWFDSRSRIQLNFRHQKVSHEFVPGGGSLTDVGVHGDYWVRRDLSISASVQHERWLFPVIQPNAEKNITASVQILFWPQRLIQRSARNAGDGRNVNGGLQ
jgi:membrane-associated phospholipid phosphatase